MKSTDISVVHTPEGIVFGGTGYGVEPCPSCGGKLTPGQRRRTVPGVWRTEHESCPPAAPVPLPPIGRMTTNVCTICGDRDHTEGSCLI